MRNATKNNRFQVLDGVRGFAVLFVLLSHAGNIKLSGLEAFSGIGHYGVYLFFVLSAFLLTLPMLSKDTAWFLDWRTWTRYFSKRALRIFPLYFVVLSASFAATQLNSDALFPISREEFWNHLTLRDGKDVFWSIPIEFKYYLFLPFVAGFFVLCRLDVARITIFLALAWIVFYKILVDFLPISNSNSHANFAYYLPVFLFGSFAALLYSKRDAFSKVPRGAWNVAAVVILLIVGITTPSMWNWLTQQNVSFDHFTYDVWLYAPLWSAFLLCVVFGGALNRVLESAPLRFLGNISFSLYLLHMPVLKAVAAAPIPAFLQPILFFGVAIGAATLSYRFIEKPSAKHFFIAQIDNREYQSLLTRPLV